VTIQHGFPAVPIPGLGRHWQRGEGARAYRAAAWCTLGCVHQVLVLPAEQPAPCIWAEATVSRDSILQKVSEGEEEAPLGLTSLLVLGLGACQHHDMFWDETFRLQHVIGRCQVSL